MAKMKYCANCQKWVTPTGGVSFWILLLLFIFGAIFAIFTLGGSFVPVLIYIVWAKFTGKRCPMCNSKNWGKPPEQAAPPPPPPTR